MDCRVKPGNDSREIQLFDDCPTAWAQYGLYRTLRAVPRRPRLRSIGGSATPMTAPAFAEQFKREVGVNAGLVKAVWLQAN
jgi:hypothetical protein